MSRDRMGRLARPPHGELLALLYHPNLAKDKQDVLPHLLEIDAAHLVMLARRSLLPRETVARLLALNRELATRTAAGEDLFGSPSAHRGLYALYESEVITRLGPEIGGSTHVARSRNDINAAVTRIRLRQGVLATQQASHRLLSALAALAVDHAGTLMSGFTHMQPAQPTSFGHYLAGVLGELVRSAEDLARALDSVNRSPLGAAAGFGTSFAIDRELVAELLGFTGVVDNSLDAVASRDDLVRVLAALAMLGVSLTRLASDLQLWASAAYGFLGWPDELVSTSSIMPQKRNAYVLENVRGRAVVPVGALVDTLLGMKNVPFTNSVEVSGEAAAHVGRALDASRTTLSLFALLMENVAVYPQRMRSFLAGRQTAMTALANHLVLRWGMAFRSAHDAVGRLLRESGEEEPTVRQVKAGLEAILAQAGTPVTLEESELARVLDLDGCLAAARFGGGPAPEAVRRQLEGLEARIGRIGEGLESWNRHFTTAGDRRREAIEEILTG